MLDKLGEDIVIRIRRKPFRHVIIDNLFRKQVYQNLCKGFNERMERGTVPKYQAGKFWKFSHYDAFCYSIDPNKDAVFGDIVYDPQWKRFLNGFFNHKLTNNVLAELHHHRPGSKNGYVHNDYDISSFLSDPMKNGTNPHRHQINYRGREKGAIHCVRSIAVLYYFNNKKWEEGFGGETALYENYDAAPVQTISPVINRLLAFEVSPKSFHTFLSNQKIHRNSLVMWFHCPEPWAVNRYNEKPK